MIWSIDDLPHFRPDSDQALLDDAAKHLTPTPSASVRCLPDPDTLSSDSTDSLRAQLHLVNQRINDIHKTIRTKDDMARAPFVALPSSKKFKIHLSHSTFASRCWRHMMAAPTQWSTWACSRCRWLCMARQTP
ncbi:hypothetical protein GW17_00031525 [Ensete ventricosum]|nr:hypothetical protein GW17_00031525 [Ensete ventricosum]